MGKVIAVLGFILPFLERALFIVENLDANDAGIDDEIARKLQEFVDYIRLVVGDAEARKPARGYDAIQRFTNDVIFKLKEILNEENPDVGKAEELVNSLSDPREVYQAKRGDDAYLLEESKVLAGDLLILIKGK